jgi:hypothetical protein
MDNKISATGQSLFTAKSGTFGIKNSLEIGQSLFLHCLLHLNPAADAPCVKQSSAQGTGQSMRNAGRSTQTAISLKILGIQFCLHEN